MAELEKKTVTISRQFDIDLVNIFEYGEETFGYSAAKIFIGEIYNYVWNLDSMYLSHPECRYMRTKSRMYRNIILGSYLIIYRITPEQVEVLKAISSRMSISKIRATRKIKL
jgi:toxin ParE1/3/4